jgi:diguanylate cyclase (GGDEF)-like protein
MKCNRAGRGFDGRVWKKMVQERLLACRLTFQRFSTGMSRCVAMRPGSRFSPIDDPGNSMFVVRSGSVAIRIGDLVYETVGAGGIIGEMALLDEDARVRSATAVAATDCEIVGDRASAGCWRSSARRRSWVSSCARSWFAGCARPQFLTHHDALTQLPNRHRFQELCRAALGRAQQHGTQVGLMLVGIDHFARLNESFGNAVGDEVLCAVGARLSEGRDALETVARLGSDHFAVLLEGQASTEELAAAAKHALKRVAAPIRALGEDIYVTASIGISCFPQDGADPETLVRSAEFAKRRAIELGRNTHFFHSAELHRDAVEAHDLANQLRGAIESEQLYLEYQPRVGIKSGRITGLEALVRWRHPDLQMVPPSRFIPIAEQSGLIDAIGDYVLRRACTQMRGWLDAGIAPARIAVNLSVRQLARADLIRASSRSSTSAASSRAISSWRSPRAR